MIDVHIITHPAQDRSRTLDKVLNQLEKEPVKVHLIEGTDIIGEGRVKGFRSGVNELVSYVDDDDAIVEGIFDKILEAYQKEPEIDALCTREQVTLNGKHHDNSAFIFKYYDKRHLHRVHHLTTYRRELILPHLHKIEDKKLTAEHHLVASVLKENARFKHLPVVGYVWQRHEGSTPSLNLTRCPESIKLYRELFKDAASEGYKPHIPEQGYNETFPVKEK